MYYYEKARLTKSVDRILKEHSKLGYRLNFGGSEGIRTPVGFLPNGFQDRLVMTTSIRFQCQ